MEERGDEARRAGRMQAERHTRRSMLRLLVCTAILRDVITRVLPQAGCAAWWLTPLLMAPGWLALLVTSALLKRSGHASIMEAVQHSYGSMGVRVLACLLAVGLWTDACRSLATLTGLLTDGIGSEGTAATLGLLTCAMLAPCMRRDGLHRAIHLLRWFMLALAAALLIGAAGRFRADHLVPLLGDGLGSIRRSVGAGWSLSWPMLMLAMEPPVSTSGTHARESLLPVLICCGVPLLIVLTQPHGLLCHAATMGEALLTPMAALSVRGRTLALCLMMMSLFLLLAAEVRLVGDACRSAVGRGDTGLVVVVIAAVYLGALAARNSVWTNVGRAGILAAWLLGVAGCTVGKRRQR